MIVARSLHYLLFSIIFHVTILVILIFSLDFATPLPVIENTTKHDIISAVILGDTSKSKILPKQLAPTTVNPKRIQAIKPIQPESAPSIKEEKDVIAIKKITDKKNQAEKKLLKAIKQRQTLAKDLLADIKQQSDKQKKLKQKQLQAHFEKTLREQAEYSLRQQLLNEELKLQSSQLRQSQGEINKYKALILQAISEHWIIPTQANKNLYCELIIRLAPGGTVLNVQVTKSSGDPSLDSSARAAVLKASPLPVPTHIHEFEAFRQFSLKVKPENILNEMGT